SGNCELKLYRDSTYSFKYPTFLRNIHESGTYKITDNCILLKRIAQNTSDSILDCSMGYYSDNPDTVQVSFRGLNDSAICVAFTINKNPAIFKTDNSGQLKISYSMLLSKEIITKDSSFQFLDIFYNGRNYHITDTRPLLSKPTVISIKLNQFVGEKTVVLYRKFSYSNDTVIVNGIDPKAIGSDRKLTRR
ncbi:MAG TPA: hypothetical protein VFJ43_02710, partial [Bacteroidia bacterium]|nr:hypothetical protein [Bacteroidia bacterium]